MDKHELQRKFKDKIDEAFKKIEALENKKDAVSGKTKEEIDEKIQALKSQKQELDNHYESLKQSTEEKIEQINVQFEKSLVNFEQGFDEIRKAFD